MLMFIYSKIKNKNKLKLKKFQILFKSYYFYEFFNNFI